MGEVVKGGAPRVPKTLEDWQVLLERAFFEGRDPAEPFIFDLEVSEQIRPWTGEENSRDKLAKCVSQALDLDSPADVFGPLEPAWRRWRSGGRTSVPPNLAVLALTVAAATEMHRDKGASSQAYFYRLAELLLPAASHEPLLALRDRLSASFDPVGEWWRDLCDWVKANPQVGVNTIQKHTHLTRIGYSMSQAIIRRSDRMRLTRFFEKLDILTLGAPSKGALLSQLKLWAATPRDFSSTLLATLEDPVRRDVLAAYLHRLASSWDGVVLNPEGSTHLDIRLAIDLDEYNSHWVVRMPADAARQEVQVNDQNVVLTLPEYGAFYEWTGPMPRVQAIPGKAAVVAKGPGIYGRFVFPPLQPLRANADVGWLSEDDVQPYTPHILLVAPESQEHVEKVLHAAARKGWRRIDQKPGSRLIPGRAVYIKVEIEDANAFKKALAQIDPSLARALRVPGSPRPRLVNGLSIYRNLGPRHYLRGGEPDLLLPVGDAPRSVPTALDQTEQEHPFYTTGFPIPLRLVGPLNVGQHVLDADGEKITFAVHATGAQGDAQTFLGWSRTGSTNEIHEVEHTAVGTTAIVGAIVNSDLPEPYLLRRHGRQYYAIDRRGNATSLSPPPHSPLFKEIGIPESTQWEYTPPIEAVWLVEKRNDGQLKAQCLRYVEPHFGKVDSESRILWEEMSKQLRESNPLLDIYLKASERLAPNAG